ncbi:MAG TPA: hypothetical protein VH641_01270 [Streptosporangiaceae bacterium]|jgi:hypothetical protein
MDWVTISSLATAGGTLVLAVATFASVRSANRAARTAELALLEGLRPLLMPSRRQDPPEKVSFVDQHWLLVNGGQGLIEVTDDVIYFAIALRNVGRGMAVLHSWTVSEGTTSAQRPDHVDLPEFRRLTRDIYVPAGDLGFWQGALRDPAEPAFADAYKAVTAGEPLSIELLYGDSEGGQRTVTRFGLIPHQGQDGETVWFAVAGRHWNLDRPEPR